MIHDKWPILLIFLSDILIHICQSVYSICYESYESYPMEKKCKYTCDFIDSFVCISGVGNKFKMRKVNIYWPTELRGLRIFPFGQLSHDQLCVWIRNWKSISGKYSILIGRSKFIFLFHFWNIFEEQAKSVNLFLEKVAFFFQSF